MANPHRGEVTLTFAGRVYTLRPTFHILSAVEHRLGMSLPELLRKIEEKGLLTSELLMILSMATQHDGSQPFDSESVLALPIGEVNLHHAMRSVARFLLQAMGGELSLDIPCLMRNSHRLLAIRPAEFWSLTMPELRLLMPASEALPSVAADAELVSLMARFPDYAATA